MSEQKSKYWGKTIAEKLEVILKNKEVKVR
jgi:hypothetical protein